MKTDKPTGTETDYLPKFLCWMLERGRLDSSGLPTEPLSKVTARNRLKKLRRMLVEMDYMEKITCGNNRYEYPYTDKPITELDLVEIKKWFSDIFPELPDDKARQRKNDYVDAILKFSQYLYFELEIWSEQEYQNIRRHIRRVTLRPIHERKIKTLPIDRTDPFIDFLVHISIPHYTMCYLMRYAGMRYAEVINARADLQNGTIIADFDRDRIVVYGKGRGGLGQIRTIPFSKESQQVIRRYLNWRKRQGIKSDWLFVNKYNEKFSDNAGHFNSWLRHHGIEYGCSEKETKLLTTHKIGRHGYATHATLKGVQEDLIRENMGIKNPFILKRYQDVSEDIRVKETLEKLTSKKNEKGELSKNQSKQNGRIKSDVERKRYLVDMLISGQITEEVFKIAAGQLQF